MSVDGSYEINSLKLHADDMRQQFAKLKSGDFSGLSFHPGFDLSKYLKNLQSEINYTAERMKAVQFICELVSELLDQKELNEDLSIFPIGALDEVNYFKFDTYRGRTILIVDNARIAKERKHYEQPELMKELLQKEFNKYFEI